MTDDETIPTGYSSMEVRYLLAPIFGIDADEMGHFVILADDYSAKKYRVIGCAHAPEFLQEIIRDGLARESSEYTKANNGRKFRKEHVQDHHTLARRMFRLPFRGKNSSE